MQDPVMKDAFAEQRKENEDKKEQDKDKPNPSKQGNKKKKTITKKPEVVVECRCMQCQEDCFDVVQFGPTCPHVMCIRCAIDYTNYQLLYCNYKAHSNPEHWFLTVAKTTWQASSDSKAPDLRGKRECPICKKGKLSFSAVSWIVYPNWVYQYLLQHVSQARESTPYEPGKEPAVRFATEWDQYSLEIRSILVKQYEAAEKARRETWVMETANKTRREIERKSQVYSCIWNCGMVNKEIAALIQHSWNCPNQTFECPLPFCHQRIKIAEGTTRIEQRNKAWQAHIKTSCTYYMLCKTCKTLKFIPLPEWGAHCAKHVAFKKTQLAMNKLRSCLLTIQRRPGTLIDCDKELKIEDIDTLATKLTQYGIPPYEIGSVVVFRCDLNWHEGRVIDRLPDGRLKIHWIEHDEIAHYYAHDKDLAYWKVQAPFVDQRVWPTALVYSDETEEEWKVASLDIKEGKVINEENRSSHLAQNATPKNACIIANSLGTKRLFVLSEQYCMIASPGTELLHGDSDPEDDDDNATAEAGSVFDLL